MNSDNTRLTKGESRTIELTVSRKSIVDKYAEWLAATKVVFPNEEVTDIEFKDLVSTALSGKDGTPLELIPIKVTIKANDASQTRLTKEAVTVH